METQPVIRLEKLEKIYQTGEVPVKAVRSVSLTVSRGDG